MFSFFVKEKTWSEQSVLLYKSHKIFFISVSIMGWDGHIKIAVAYAETTNYVICVH